MTVKCPICKKVDVAPGDPEFPFCSERCRTLDLANWATGKYVIPGGAGAKSTETEDDE
jgi:endogenous inhibitor of DNA gyrase (YacG/DUF329 family)